MTRSIGRSFAILSVAAALAAPASAHQPVEDQILELNARIARDPVDASLYLARGEKRRHLRQWAKALSDYSRARRLDPGLHEVDLCTGLLMLDSARPEKALVYLDRYLLNEPDRVDGLVTRARARVELKRFLDGAEDYTRAIAEYRGDDLPTPEQYLDRARALAAAGDAHIEEALAGLEAGLLRLGAPPTLERLAMDLEIRRGRPDLAEARRARLARAPSSPGEPPLETRPIEIHVEDEPSAPDPNAGFVATSAPSTPSILVDFNSTFTYLANSTDPGIGPGWIAEIYDDSAWSTGLFGIGYESGAGAQNLLRTTVPAGTSSVYTRTTFDIADIGAVRNVFLGADYDDGYVAWINGVEVYRSPELTRGALLWDTRASLHESSNAAIPRYGSLIDITAAALPALHGGDNVLAVGIWNAAPPSSDLVLVPELSINHAASILRGPYLQKGTPTGLIVRWRTDTPSDSRVRYGSDPGQLTAAVDVALPSIDHVVELTGLQPATKYFYSIGSTRDTLAGDDQDHFFITSPVAGTPQPSRIWVLGDSGTADSRPRMVRDAYESFTGATHTDLWLMLGDNAYQDGTDAEFQAAVFDVYPKMLAKSVLWPTLGNHDGHTAFSSTQSGPYYEIFSLPAMGEAGGVVSGTEAYYAFDYANIHFICLDSYDLDRSTGGAMMTWLRQDIAATRQDWVIAFWHHPPYSKGSHDSDTAVELIDMRKNALPILEGTGVDLVLAGHSHDYERSFLLDGHYGTSNTLVPSMKLDPGSGRVGAGGAYQKFTLGPAPHEGAVYVVAGSSGQIAGGQLNHPAMFLSLATLGSLVLDVSGKELHAAFLDATGSVRDEFTMRKGHNLPPAASAGMDIQEECAGPAGAWVRLDGSFSSDPDSTPGTHDDVAGFDWFEDFGLPSQRAIGTGEMLSAQLILGKHRITLRVTDRAGLISTDDLVADVVDTTPPTLSVALSPDILWPPNHRLVDVAADVAIGDLCGIPAVALISIASSEPDDAVGRGDGRTIGDIRDADPGAADLLFRLRAERAGRLTGRIYTVTYRAIDPSGNIAEAAATVAVTKARAPSAP